MERYPYYLHKTSKWFESAPPSKNKTPRYLIKVFFKFPSVLLTNNTQSSQEKACQWTSKISKQTLTLHSTNLQPLKMSAALGHTCSSMSSLFPWQILTRSLPQQTGWFTLVTTGGFGTTAIQWEVWDEDNLMRKFGTTALDEGLGNMSLLLWMLLRIAAGELLRSIVHTRLVSNTASNITFTHTYMYHILL